MKNKISYIFAIATVVLMNPRSVFAENDLSEVAPGPINPELGVSQIISFVINAFFFVAIVAALFYLLWGGLNWILSGGDKDKIDAARGRIIAAIIGLVIVILAYFILDFALRLLGLCGIRDIQLPSLGNLDVGGSC